jgi:hypothetical protein
MFPKDSCEFLMRKRRFVFSNYLGSGHNYHRQLYTIGHLIKWGILSDPRPKRGLDSGLWRDVWGALGPCWIEATNDRHDIAMYDMIKCSYAKRVYYLYTTSSSNDRRL